ncbi:MAG: hypothetical protein GY786_03900 [Proteobacteria bacterium]|nr:hypothetical protein [Pseudomonadota bacterium]
MIKWILGMFIVLSFSTVGYSEEIIRITNGEWPPSLSKDLKYYGVGSRTVAEAFALEGIKVEYGFFPWGRFYRYAKRGDWDGSILTLEILNGTLWMICKV